MQTPCRDRALLWQTHITAPHLHQDGNFGFALWFFYIEWDDDDDDDAKLKTSVSSEIKKKHASE